MNTVIPQNTDIIKYASLMIRLVYLSEHLISTNYCCDHAKANSVQMLDMLNTMTMYVGRLLNKQIFTIVKDPGNGPVSH